MKRKRLLVLLFILAAWGSAPAAAPAQSSADDGETDSFVLKKLEWFQDVNFGLMMHWGF